jgi:phage nucleotide-binding protein
MEIRKFDDALQADSHYTALLYCPPGVGKSTAIGLIAEASEGNTLVLDVDRTITKTLAKKEIVKDTSKVFIEQVDNINTFDAWSRLMEDLRDMAESGQLKAANITTIAVDNISELERCILSDLGAKGKNKGVPAMADYQYMQFKLVNSLRQMKALGVNVVWTAWEITEQFTAPDGSQYSRLYPKCSTKIVDNICGLCDVVGKIFVNKEGQHGILLEATQNIYAKNQIDSRKACKIEDFVKFGG